jgi:hypothetical protein
MSFDGRLLSRGFWLYVCEITHPGGKCYYVGRTGDSSSPFAQSPFNRVGRHLDFSKSAKANSMAKQLQAQGIVPFSCHFHLAAIGPIFPQQNCREKHDPIRNRLAAVERDLAGFIKGRGYQVLGQHGASTPSDQELLQRVLDVIGDRFPSIKQSSPTGT